MIQAPKNHLKNLLFVIVFGVLFFTPLGTSIKVGFLRLISTSPVVESVDNQQVLSLYSGTILDENGQTIPFENFKNKTILVNFWATWCPPCIAEMPSLQKLYDDYKDKVDFLLITHDSSEKVKEFMTRNGYHMPVYYQEENLPKALFSKTIPATFLINPQGKILIKKIGIADWNSTNVRQIIEQQ